MIGIPHPYALIQHANDRCAEMLVLAEQERLARQAPRAAARPSWSGFAAAVAVMVVVAVVLAARETVGL